MLFNTCKRLLLFNETKLMYVCTILKLKYLSLFYFSSSRVPKNYFNCNTDLNEKAKKSRKTGRVLLYFLAVLETQPISLTGTRNA